MNPVITDKLAPVFLDNQPISLKDPKPKVSAVLSASGKPEATEVKWLQFQPNTQGKALRSEEVLDRTTDPTRPIYLTSTNKGQAPAFGAKGNEAAAGIAPVAGEAARTSGQSTQSGQASHAQSGQASHSGQSGQKTQAQAPTQKPVQDDDSEGMQSDADRKGENDEEKADDE
ncbi:MAG: hypothetical protein ACYC2H_12820 [Thermoplasmatota archaeon]